MERLPREGSDLVEILSSARNEATSNVHKDELNSFSVPNRRAISFLVPNRRTNSFSAFDRRANSFSTKKSVLRKNGLRESHESGTWNIFPR